MGKNNSFSSIEINEGVIDRVISGLTINDSEYSCKAHKINNYISEIQDYLNDKKDFTPEIYDKIKYIITNLTEAHSIELNAMYYAGILDAVKIVNTIE